MLFDLFPPQAKCGGIFSNILYTKQNTETIIHTQPAIFYSLTSNFTLNSL